MPDRTRSRVSALGVVFFILALVRVAPAGVPLRSTGPAPDQAAPNAEVRPADSRAERQNLERAEADFAGKRCGPAIAGYAKSGASLRRDPSAVLHYAECEIEEGRDPQAPGVLALLSPKDGEHHFEAGEMLVRHRAFRAAAREFGKARAFYSDPYTAGYDETLADYNAGDFQAAISTANEMLNQGHRTAELADLAGNAYLRNQQPQEAYNAFRLATGLDPRNEDSYVDLCSLSLDLERFDLGIEIAELGLKHLPDSERLHLERGVLLAMKGDFDRAHQDFAVAATLAPGEVAPLVSEGVLAMQMDRLDQAVGILRRATAQAPGSYLAQYWYAVALLRNGATPGTPAGDQALSALEASVRSNPDYWHSQADLGKALLDRSELEPAISHLERAAALNPAATTPLYVLAQAYRRKGDEERAQALILRVSKMQAEDRQGLASDLKQVVLEGTSARAAERSDTQH